MPFPGCMPVCNRILVIFERTIQQGRCHLPTKHLRGATFVSAKNNWKLGVLLYVKRMPLNSAYL